jgi:hypothetical protein
VFEQSCHLEDAVKELRAMVEVEIAHGVLPSEQSLCDLDKVVGGLVVEVAGDPNGCR